MTTPIHAIGRVSGCRTLDIDNSPGNSENWKVFGIDINYGRMTLAQYLREGWTVERVVKAENSTHIENLKNLHKETIFGDYE